MSLGKSVDKGSSSTLAEMIEMSDSKSRETDKMTSLIFKLSWIVNVILLVAKIIALIYTNYSKAVAASLADSAVDILSQFVLSISQYYMDRPSKEYPVGRARLEALGVICCSCIMSMSSFEVIQYSLQALYGGFILSDIPVIIADIRLYVILGGGTLLKIVLWVFCMRITPRSDSLEALAEDHLNDVVSNLAAIATAVIAAKLPEYWWTDGIGAILISAWIISRWVNLTLEQVEKVIGKSAPYDFIVLTERIAREHHSCIEVDCTRAYHFGSRFMVEMEIIMPSTMTLTDTHDISLALQHKLEALDEVERAFVHVDYQRRDYPEHKVERKLLETTLKADESTHLLSWPLSTKSAGNAEVVPFSPPV